MASQFFTERRIEDVAAAYVAARSKSSFLSINQAIRAIRTLMPACELSDRELADMVASAAVRQFIPVSFDGHTEGRKASL
jgi:hypothetical protein